jgi:hypothetical protein
LYQQINYEVDKKGIWKGIKMEYYGIKAHSKNGLAEHTKKDIA